MRYLPDTPAAKSVLLVLAALAAPFAAPAAEPGVAVSNPWFRFVIPSRPAAGYFTLSNDSATARVLVGAESPACGMLMLHRSLHQGNQERMVMVDSVPVPAHGQVTFAPGGYHLMCTSPGKDVAPGHSVPVTFSFQDGASVTANFAVRGPSGR